MADSPTTAQLPAEGELPSFEGATGWLNSEPLTASRLSGHPVLVEFWTLTCINWIRTLPYVRAWHDRYSADGLVVIGVHTPEFEIERNVGYLRRAVQEMGVDFPVAVDSDYAIWRAFANSYWPALYFADADGQIRHHRFGEGEYETSETVIQRLLAASGAAEVDRGLVSISPGGIEAPADWDDLLSPETYIGYQRASNFASPGGALRHRPHDYAVPGELRLNRWALGGTWTVGRETAVLDAAGGKIAHRFHARDLHLVMAPPPDGRDVRFRVLLDGRAPGADHGVDTDADGEGIVTAPRLYQLIRQRTPIADRTFEITFFDSGANAFVFTFG